MGQFRAEIRRRARGLGRRIVLPEGDDPRVFSAAEQIARLGIAEPIVLMSEPRQSERRSGVQIIFPDDAPYMAKFKIELFENDPGFEGDPGDFLSEPLHFAAMMVRTGEADGAVCGATTETSAVVRTGLQLVGRREGNEIVSSSFLMAKDDRAFTFADCGVIPEPTGDELVSIASEAGKTHQLLTGEKPRVAFLSFSTKGSGEHASVERMRWAAKRFAECYPDVASDGELQFDAAVIPEIARAKAPSSPLRGDANVLIFPDLSAGNIAYKIAQRLGGFSAWGPLLQGLKRPVMDLSRGCDVEDIIDVSAICALMG